MASSYPSLLLRYLLRHLTADFAAGIVLGMHVDIVLAGLEIGGLRSGQRRAALGRARRRIRDRDRNARVLAGFRGTMEMRGGGGAAETRIGQLPRQLLGSRVIVDVGGAGALAGIRRNFGVSVQRCLELLGERRSCEGDRRRKRKRGIHGFLHGSLPVDVDDATALETTTISK